VTAIASADGIRKIPTNSYGLFSGLSSFAMPICLSPLPDVVAWEWYEVRNSADPDDGIRKKPTNSYRLFSRLSSFAMPMGLFPLPDVAAREWHEVRKSADLTSEEEKKEEKEEECMHE
jgi:hypothetical protein